MVFHERYRGPEKNENKNNPEVSEALKLTAGTETARANHEKTEAQCKAAYERCDMIAMQHQVDPREVTNNLHQEALNKKQELEEQYMTYRKQIETQFGEVIFNGEVKEKTEGANTAVA